MNCCNHTHPFDLFDVEQQWRPTRLRCLIVGENPGDKGSPYFYDPPWSYENDPVKVRYGLLTNIFQQKLLPSPTLEGFQEAGFLFDHAIRCLLPKEAIKKERPDAARNKAKRVENPEHLREALAHAPIVWVMGHWACNAVANAADEFPKQRRKISKPPFPGEAGPESRFFVSEYLTWRNPKKWPDICAAFAQFARSKHIF